MSLDALYPFLNGSAPEHPLVMPSASVHPVQEVQTTVHHVLRELVQGALAAE